MITTPEYDTAPLSWIKNEVDHALQQVNEAIEQYKLTEDDPAKLRQMRTHLHQVTGAVEMVGLPGVTLVCQEMEKLTEALELSSITINQAALDSIRTASRTIEHYLDELLKGKPNLELQLFPIYQQLRLARGINHNNESDLFFPDMTHRAPQSADICSLSTAERTQSIKKSRATFQRGLLAFLRQKNTDQGLADMHSAVLAMETAMGTPASRTFWWGASAFVDCLINRSIEPSFAVKQLCGRIDLQMRRHIEGSHKIAERLLRDLLYFIAQSRDINEHIAAVKNTFDLARLIPAQTGSSKEINELRHALKKILLTLNDAKEFWIKLASGNQDSLTPFQTYISELRSLSAPLNNPQITKLIDEIHGIAADFSQLPAQRHEMISLEVATTLLLIQNNLEHYENISPELIHQTEVQIQRLKAAAYSETDLAEVDNVPLLDEISRQAQEKLLMAQVAQEIQLNIQKIEEALDSFFRDSLHDRQLIAGLNRPMTEIHGALSIMQMDAANQVLERTHLLIAQLIDPAVPVDETQFPVIADAISSISLYVDAQRHQRPQALHILRPILIQFGLIEDYPAANATENDRVEDELNSLKFDLHNQLDAWQNAPDEQDTKKKLVATLREINQDAELVGDLDLKLQTAEAIQQIQAGEHQAALDELSNYIVNSPAPTEAVNIIQNTMDEDVDAELLEIFLEEATEVLAATQDALATLTQQSHDLEAMRTIRRSFHTLKGSGRMVGLNNFGEAAWSIEQLMNFWLQEEKTASDELITLLNQSHQLFSTWVNALQTHAPLNIEYKTLIGQAEQLRIDQRAQPAESDAADIKQTLLPAAELENASALHYDAGLTGLTEPTDLTDDSTTNANPAENASPVELLEFSRHEPIIELSAATAISDERIESTPLSIAIEPLVDDDTLSFIMVSEPIDEHTAGDTVLDTVIDDAGRIEPLLNTAAEPAIEQITGSDAVEFSTAGYSYIEPNRDEAGAITLDAAESSPADERIAIGSNLISPLLLDIFLREADQHYHTLRSEFNRLKNNPDEVVSFEFMRAAHTLAGIASLTGFNPIADLAHALEAWLNRLQSLGAVLPNNDDSTDLAIAKIAAMLDSVRNRESPHTSPELIDLLNHAPIKITDPAYSNDDIDIDNVMTEQTVEIPLPAVINQLVEEGIIHPVSTLNTLLLPSDKQDHQHTITDDVDEQLLPIFLEEATDLMPAIEQSVRNWRRTPGGDEQTNIQRLLHTLKGSARMAGAMRLGELAHTLETEIIDTVNKQSYSDTDFDRFETQVDQLNLAVEQLRHPNPVVAVAQPAIAAGKIDDAVDARLAAQIAPANPTLVADAEASTQNLRVRADMVDRLVNEAGEINIARSRLESSVANIRTGTLELNENTIRLRSQLRELEIQAESQMQSTLSHMRNEDAQFDPLEFDRFTRLQELTRMIAESVNDIGTVQQNLIVGLNETDAAITQQGRLAKDLQQALMHIRMVPLASISDRLHRTVRLAAKDLGKKASLQLVGGQVEFDRGVLDKMVAPLEHLLRNSVAHGIEMPNERVSANKSEYGEIVLYTRQEGNEIIITLRDDGRGLNLEAIHAKGIENGLITADDELSPDALMQLIFASGFSTAESITSIAGRGVGMDVVKSEITQLGGRIELATETGKGAQFSIYLPLTLAVAQAVMITVSDRLYAVPSATVEQVQEYKIDRLNELLEAREIIWQNNHYDFFYLPHLMGDTERQPLQQKYSPILLLRSGNQRVAILVDRLTGNQEVVVKNIGPQLSRVLGIAGATVMGNGQIVLILNPVQLAQRQGESVRNNLGHAPLPAAAENTDKRIIMVVDDSLTVRKIASRMLSREGYEVVTAKDGLDALQLLQNTLPDVMLLDIEMPRMDGFELTKIMRADQRMAQIPIIMITSRTADKHRDHAFSLGVNAYMGKPYQDDVLLEKIAELSNVACPI